MVLGMAAFVRRRGRALLVGMFVLAAARPSAALTIGGDGGPAFEVDPVWFTEFGEFGLSGPGNGPEFIAVAPITFLSIAAEPATGFDLGLAQSLQEPVYQHPQDPANSQNPGTNGGVASVPTQTVPFVADSRWTVRNLTERPLDDLVLVFTRIIDAPGYPVVDVALDQNVYDVISYTNAAGVVRYYGAIELGDMAPGDSVDFDVRYIVSGALPIQNGEYVMPRFGLAAVESPSRIPEPGTALLLGLGLAAIARRRRD